MGLLSASNLTKSFGADEIFSGVSFEIQENDHIGLVGVNGCGKTTLLKLLTGEIYPDNGNIIKSNKTKLGYMEQHVCRDLDKSAYNEVLTVFADLLQLEKDLEEINIKLQTKPKNIDSLIQKQVSMNEHYVNNGGLTCKSRAKSTLLGLGFKESELGMPIAYLSGGQKAKLQLAKMLLSGANLLLLDEPTNHLDIDSIEWLEDFLRTYTGSFVVISHDRYFLDKITNQTFEIENQKLTLFKGNYSDYISQKAENNLSAQRKYDNTIKEISRIEHIVTQQKQWNREKSIKKAESKQKVIDRLEKTLEKPDAEPETINFNFNINRRSGNDVLTTENLSLGFEHKRLFQNVNLEIHRGERVFLIGPNGCGKTSLLKTLLGIYSPDNGNIRFGAGVETGYYDQIQANLSPEKTVIDEIWDCYPKMTQTEVRNALAVFLFKGDDVFKSVSVLSGGERARVLLLRLMLSRANFLLLDEPTNHLDIGSCEALESALRSYKGTLLIVSHDRYLINKIADKIYCFDESGVEQYIGNYDNYIEHRPSKILNSENYNHKKPNDYKIQKEKQAYIRKKKAKLRHYESEIEEIETKLSELETELSSPNNASDYEAAMKITKKITKLKEENDELFIRWSELAEKLDK